MCSKLIFEFNVEKRQCFLVHLYIEYLEVFFTIYRNVLSAVNCLKTFIHMHVSDLYKTLQIV